MSIQQGLCSYNNGLMAAWKGQPNDNRLFFSQFNGTKWSAAGTVDGNSSVGPSLAVYNGAVYAAWKGEWSDPRIFFAKFNGTTWEPQAQIASAYSEFGPALGVFGTQLVAAWKNACDKSLYYATYNGTNWVVQGQIPGVASSVGPSLAAYGSKLYAAWKGEGADQGIYYAFYDGSWSAQTQIPNVGSSVGPSLAAVGPKLYAIWKGETTNQGLYYASFNGTSWSAQAQIPGVTSSVGAALADFNGTPYAMWKGGGSDIRLWDSSFNGVNWSPESNDIPGNTGPDPLTLLAAPPGSSTNYTLSDSKGAALTGVTVTMIVTEDIVTDQNLGYSLQINCNSTPQAAGAHTYGWQQFGFRMAANLLFFWVNTFQADSGASPNYINWDSRGAGLQVSLPNNILPKGWQLTTTLATDKNNNVTGFAFSIVQADGSTLNSGLLTLQSLNGSVVPGVAPILNLQVILVAENPAQNGPTDAVTFSAGEGIFLCYAANSLIATAGHAESGETSNMNYSALPASYPNGEFFQLFGLSLT
jgi:hypothetical protein